MEFQKKESEKIYMKNKVYLIWLINDDVDPMVVGIATSEDKANSMRDKLASTDGFEFNDYMYKRRHHVKRLQEQLQFL